MRTILVALESNSLTAEQIERIREVAPQDTSVVMTRDREEIQSILDQIEIVAGWFPADMIPQAPNLRWYQQWSAGADWLLRHPEVAQEDFVLTSTSGIHAIQITEHIFALLLAFARELPRALEAQKDREWIPSRAHEHLFELAGKTMVLIGVGSIGRRTARVAQAIGMRVLSVRRDPTVDTPGVEAVFGPDEPLDLLPEADIVVLTVPLTEETRGLIAAGELRAMKQTSILVNVGRGGVVDEEALVLALEEGRIAGAGLDAFETEPLPEDSPLWTLDNVIITSHYAGITPNYHERALGVFLDNLQRHVAGEPLQNIVDKELGY
ncbi:MAG: D-2-hydroxyacid dehydrogenase [Chloroflexota bacterium]